ncbi:MAG TPA: diguanylate cyclase, partial [Euzebyales bacterium]|nr:diguanylate cyclase [Euzebyales bacterium]
MGKRLRRYVAVATVAGVLSVALVHVVGAGWQLRGEGVMFVALTAMVVLGDLAPLWAPRRDRDGLVPVSPVFALAMLLRLGAAPAMAAAAISSLVAGIARRQHPMAIRFAMAQRAVSVLVGAAVLWLGTTSPFGAPVPVRWQALPAMVIGCALFIATSLALTSVATALTARDTYGRQAARPLRLWLRRELTARGRYAGLLVSLAPIVALAAERHVSLLILFALPAIAVSRSIAIAAGRHHHALHDELTGLPNRQLLADRIDQAVALARRHGDRTAVLVLDLNGFGDVNDTLGRGCGDALLQQVAGRMVQTLRGVDTVARIGADEFAVVLHGVRGRDDAEVVARNLRRRLSTPAVIAGVPLAVEVSIGAALWPDHGGTPEALLRCAESAAQRAKHQRGGYRLYAASPAGGINRMQLLARLRDGLARNELEVHFQPQALLSTGELVGAEALVRW